MRMACRRWRRRRHTASRCEAAVWEGWEGLFRLACQGCCSGLLAFLLLLILCEAPPAMYARRLAASSAPSAAPNVQAEVAGYADNYPPDAMLFMDFRRHHTGLYDGTASRCAACSVESGNCKSGRVRRTSALRACLPLRLPIQVWLEECIAHSGAYLASMCSHRCHPQAAARQEPARQQRAVGHRGRGAATAAPLLQLDHCSSCGAMPCLPAFRWWKRQLSGAPPSLPA